MGADVTEYSDGLVIHGGRPLHGARLNSHGDHRIAMAFAIAGLFADGETVIEDTACVETSYPGFAAQLRQLFGENG
jgi:3-phosphoshikimate 1-carboxyvinyltransferase